MKIVDYLKKIRGYKKTCYNHIGDDMYRIEDISATLIDYANKKNYYITNLHLQKLLFFFQVEYYKEYNTFAFEEEFQAWEFGPVNYNIWKSYSTKVVAPILDIKIGNVIIEKKMNTFLECKLDKYFRANVWNLVEKSHEFNAWISKYGCLNNAINYQELGCEINGS